LLQEIEAGDYTMLIVAGDLAAFPGLQAGIDLLMQTVTADYVIYVPGNHDFYHSTFFLTSKVLRQAEMVHPRFTLLDRSAVTCDGVDIVGATLWFPYNKPTPWDRSLSDFQCIHGFRSWVGRLASESRDWLDKTVTQNSIVVTHHMPHHRSVSPEYVDSPLNRFFLHEVGEDLVSRPKLWVHGHTHSSMDYQVGNCRVVCNPLGYVKGHPTEPNPEFRSDFDIEV
jgi:predicted phosphodiesterase